MPTTSVITVGIVDDSERDRSVIREYLERYRHEHAVSFLVREYADGAALLESYQADVDILFLDIKMDGIDGMTAAEAIRRVDAKVFLVFVTSTAQYATQGYAVQAQSYLLKPVTYFAFETETNRSIARLRQSERESILVGSGAAIRRVDVSDICYIESNRHRITIHTAGGDIALSGTLKAFESELSDHPFHRANSGYLVNLRHVRAIDNDEVVLADGETLRISRSRKRGLMEALADYIGGRPL